jgi:hypothetical protein
MNDAGWRGDAARAKCQRHPLVGLSIILLIFLSAIKDDDWDERATYRRLSFSAITIERFATIKTASSKHQRRLLSSRRLLQIMLG